MFRRPLSAIAFLLLATTAVFAQDMQNLGEDEKPKVEAKAPQFMRVVRDKQGEPIAFQTATVSYSYNPPASIDGDLVDSDAEIKVDVIGVVHVGEKGYYIALNKQFKQYDSLCYELVAPRGTRVPRGGKKDGEQHPMAMVQNLMKSFLQLDHQLSIIDYQAKNFVHADMSPDEMKAAQAKRGDTQATVMMSVLADMMRQQNLQAARMQAAGKEPPTMRIGDLMNTVE